MLTQLFPIFNYLLQFKPLIFLINIFQIPFFLRLFFFQHIAQMNIPVLSACFLSCLCRYWSILPLPQLSDSACLLLVLFPLLHRLHEFSFFRFLCQYFLSMPVIIRFAIRRILTAFNFSFALFPFVFNSFFSL